jgi:2-hydroxychromene-2-carboxylate isomerase
MRTEYLENDLRRYAADRGLDLGTVHREIDTTLAALGLLWLRRHSPADAGEYVERIFARIWRDNGDASSLAYIETVLGDLASGFGAYATREGPRELAAVREELVEVGVWNVPAFVSHGEVFVGRQHLPIVEWLATGRTGPPPI